MGILIVGIVLQVVIVAILGGKWNKRSPFPKRGGYFYLKNISSCRNDKNRTFVRMGGVLSYSERMFAPQGGGHLHFDTQKKERAYTYPYPSNISIISLSKQKVPSHKFTILSSSKRFPILNPTEYTLAHFPLLILT